MKIKKIIDLCKASEFMVLYNTENEGQWISDGRSMYPLEGFPKVTPQTICDMYDIPQAKQSKMVIREEYTAPAWVDLADASAEKEADPISIALRINGSIHIPYIGEQGVSFVDIRHLVVFDDADQEYLKLYERSMTNGNRYFAIKIGMILSGIVLPDQEIANVDLCENLALLTAACERTVEAREASK